MRLVFIGNMSWGVQLGGTPEVDNVSVTVGLLSSSLPRRIWIYRYKYIIGVFHLMERATEAFTYCRLDERVVIEP
jgi:hypothetical protein